MTQRPLTAYEQLEALLDQHRSQGLLIRPDGSTLAAPGPARMLEILGYGGDDSSDEPDDDDDMVDGIHVDGHGDDNEVDDEDDWRTMVSEPVAKPAAAKPPATDQKSEKKSVVQNGLIGDQAKAEILDYVMKDAEPVTDHEPDPQRGRVYMTAIFPATGLVEDEKTATAWFQSFSDRLQKYALLKPMLMLGAMWQLEYSASEAYHAQTCLHTCDRLDYNDFTAFLNLAGPLTKPIMFTRNYPVFSPPVMRDKWDYCRKDDTTRVKSLMPKTFGIAPDDVHELKMS